MARILILTDRTPNDSDWRGAVVWRTATGLAENHHEVILASTNEPGTAPSPARLEQAQPAKHFLFSSLPQWLRLTAGFRPHVIQVMAPKPSRWPAAATIWPYFVAFAFSQPQWQRVAVTFCSSDLEADSGFQLWWREAQHRLSYMPINQPGVQTLPWEWDGDHDETQLMREAPTPALVIPVPYDAWEKPQLNLLRLVDYLEQNPNLHARWVGGWGRAAASKRRQGWQWLEPVAERIQHLPALSTQALAGEMSQAQGVWLTDLPAHHWASGFVSQMAKGLGIPVLGEPPPLARGSAANFLSRLYADS